MPKLISRRTHGFIEHNYIAAVATAPQIAGFEDDKTAVLACRIFSSGVLVTSLLTRAEWGMVRVIPYKVHLAIDIASSVAALAVPWLFGFAQNERARNAFLAMGISGLVVGSLSDPEEMP
ncbi:MAG: hypothetical protein V4671_13690 [Armatimonadota bacterium]